MPTKILMFGPPGSGKETQVKELSRWLHVTGLSIGVMAEKEVAAKTPLGEEIRPYITYGDMMPPAMLQRLLLAQVAIVSTDGYVMNGYPRTIDQLREYLKTEQPTLAVHLKLSDEECRARLLIRRRTSDNDLVITKKLQRYHEQESAVCEIIKSEHLFTLLELDALQSPMDITAEILEELARRTA